MRARKLATARQVETQNGMSKERDRDRQRKQRDRQKRKQACESESDSDAGGYAGWKGALQYGNSCCCCILSSRHECYCNPNGPFKFAGTLIKLLPNLAAVSRRTCTLSVSACLSLTVSLALSLAVSLSRSLSLSLSLSSLHYFLPLSLSPPFFSL